MLSILEIKDRLKDVFNERQAEVLSSIIFSSYNELVKTSDFNELKGIVKELAESQKKSEERLTRLEVAVEELIESQKKSEERLTRLEVAVEELTVAQKELTEAQKKTEIEIQELTKGLKYTRIDLGGLSRSIGYAFENEAYRMLPGILKNKYGIEITKKLIREEVCGREINIFGFGKKDGNDILIIGEATLRLDEEREDIFDELEDKVLSVSKEYKNEVVSLLVTHYATKEIIKKAKEKGIILIQSFEW